LQLTRLTLAISNITQVNFISFTVLLSMLFLHLDAAIFIGLLEVHKLFIDCLLLLISVKKEIIKHSISYFILGMDSNKKNPQKLANKMCRFMRYFTNQAK
jgi:hypothetical protein